MQTTLKRVVFIRSDRYLVSSRSRHNRETKQRNREIMWCPIIQGFHISCLREGLHCMVTTTCRCYQYHTSGQCGRGPSELASVSRPVGNSCLQTSQLLVSAWYGPYRMVHMFKYNALARPSSLLIKSITPPLSGQSGRGPSELASVSQPSEREEGGSPRLIEGRKWRKQFRWRSDWR